MAFERIEPGTREWDECYAGHLFRYQFAAEHLRPYRPCRILDIACGVGYGAKYLAESLAAAVVGVDRSQDALAVARTYSAHPNVEYKELDCERLEHCVSADVQFDAIVSFETVEHLGNARGFLSGLRASISTGGMLVLSTPNVSVRASGEQLSRFHEREYTAMELVSLLETAGFSAFSLFGQQLTPVGRVRAELREELLQLTLNPMTRFGRFLQRKLRGHNFFRMPMPELLSDFDLVTFSSPAECDALGRAGPPVLLIMAQPIATSVVR